jgi:hypothetical protein
MEDNDLKQNLYVTQVRSWNEVNKNFNFLEVI